VYLAIDKTFSTDWTMKTTAIRVANASSVNREMRATSDEASVATSNNR
jgi:hypothetical protein